MDVSTTTNILPHPDTPTSVMDLPPIPEKSPPRPPTPARQFGMSNECPVLPPFPTFDPVPPPPQILDLSIALLSAFALGSLTAGVVVWSFSKRSTTCT